jgi:MerR family mercuric resistance operon transcriptional regulator
MRSGEVAAAAGVNQQTLRYYERRGLLPEPDRTLGGHRAYPADAVTTVRVIKAAQRLGFTLAEVAELLAAARHRHGLSADRDAVSDASLQRRARAKLVEVEERIADLEVIRESLLAAQEAGCDDLVECAENPGCPLPFAQLAGGASPSVSVLGR